MNKLEQIAKMKAELAAAELEAAGEIEAAKQTVMAEIVGHMEENKITLQELSLYCRTTGSKYSSGTDTWSGKGKKPAWVVKLLAEGGKLEDFLTKKTAAAAA